MHTRTTTRRIGGVLGVLTVFLTLALGAYGALSGYVLDPSTARPVATALAGVVVLAFVSLASAIGANGGGWLETPYW